MEAADAAEVLVARSQVNWRLALAFQMLEADAMQPFFLLLLRSKRQLHQGLKVMDDMWLMSDQ